jgi:hypothetical protein
MLKFLRNYNGKVVEVAKKFKSHCLILWKLKICCTKTEKFDAFILHWNHDRNTCWHRIPEISIWKYSRNEYIQWILTILKWNYASSSRHIAISLACCIKTENFDASMCHWNHNCNTRNYKERTLCWKDSTVEKSQGKLMICYIIRRELWTGVVAKSMLNTKGLQFMKPRVWKPKKPYFEMTNAPMA